MKSVLISIQPKWCERIANKEKTIEVRKTRPKIDTPFKCYIYCTNDRKVMLDKSESGKIYLNVNIYRDIPMGFNGKVIGEFVCDWIEEIYELELTPSKKYYEFEKERLDLFLEQSCLSYDEICKYIKNLPHFKPLYGWHISDLVIYDKPKELSEFMRYKYFDWWDYGYHENKRQRELCSLTRPPQSWCYVEELQGEKK